MKFIAALIPALILYSYVEDPEDAAVLIVSWVGICVIGLLVKWEVQEKE